MPILIMYLEDQLYNCKKFKYSKTNFPCLSFVPVENQPTLVHNTPHFPPPPPIPNARTPLQWLRACLPGYFDRLERNFAGK